MGAMNQQLLLPVAIPEDVTLDTFEVGDNGIVLQHLASLPEQQSNATPLTYLWGAEGVGKSHLLWGFCENANSQDLPALYIDAKDLLNYDVSMLEGLEFQRYLCIDNIHLLAQDRNWQVGLFDLINRVIEQGQCHLLVTANASPKQLPLQLPDLMSRLSWGIAFQIQPLNDQQLLAALQKHIKQKGLGMAASVLDYLIRHRQRNITDLLAYIDQLADYALQRRRRITLPLLKEYEKEYDKTQGQTQTHRSGALTGQSKAAPESGLDDDNLDKPTS